MENFLLLSKPHSEQIVLKRETNSGKFEKYTPWRQSLEGPIKCNHSKERAVGVQEQKGPITKVNKYKVQTLSRVSAAPFPESAT